MRGEAAWKRFLTNDPVAVVGMRLWDGLTWKGGDALGVLCEVGGCKSTADQNYRTQIGTRTEQEEARTNGYGWRS